MNQYQQYPQQYQQQYFNQNYQSQSPHYTNMQTVAPSTTSPQTATINPTTQVPAYLNNPTLPANYQYPTTGYYPTDPQQSQYNYQSNPANGYFPPPQQTHPRWTISIILYYELFIMLYCLLGLYIVKFYWFPLQIVLKKLIIYLHIM